MILTSVAKRIPEYNRINPHYDGAAQKIYQVQGMEALPAIF